VRVGALPLLALSFVPLPARAAETAPPAAPHTYLIMPFENTAEDPSLEWLSTGLALTLGESLLGFGSQVVDEEDRAVLLEGNGIPPGARITLASALELGRRMRARPGLPRPDRMILGRFNVTEGDLTLSLRSIDLPTEKARAWTSRQGRLKNLLAVETTLALALAKAEGISITDSKSEVLAQQTGDLPLLAFEHYCRGMAETDSRKRLQLLRRAVQEYPGYPKAAYQAAALLVKAERWDEAAEMLKKAVSDPHPYESSFHLLSATIALQHRDPVAAEAAARRALAIAPTARGHALLGRALLARGDREAARAELQQSTATDAADPDVDDLRRALAEGAQPGRRNP
jgi:tetratricopeptide (TPR) repeat protein